MTLALRYAVRSDIGLLREGNEDSAYAGPHLLAVADGMGGHAAGEVASAVAIKTLAPLDADTDDVDLAKVLTDAVRQANEALHEITEADPSTQGMGTTLTAMLWSGDQLALGHVGDSRAYLLREGSLSQLSHDHTLVQSLVDEGKLTPEEAASHPQRSLVLRALQSSIPADPDLVLLKAQAGDRYMLCSDGLTDVVSDETLTKTLSEVTDLDDAAEQLVDLAIRSGGPDNITCILADVVDPESGQEPSGEVILVGAVASEDVKKPARSDSPAARAHLLTRGFLRPVADDAADDASDGSQHVSQGDDGDRADGTVMSAERRRWPLVTSILVVLVVVIGVGGYVGWRVTQNQYFVGADGGRVAVFRGVNTELAGISLSSLVLKTDIPLTKVPEADVGQITATIPAQNFHQAEQIVFRIRRDYTCSTVAAAIRAWAAHRPPPASHANKTATKHPAPRPSASKHGTTKHGTTKSAAAHQAAAHRASAAKATPKASATPTPTVRASAGSSHRPTPSSSARPSPSPQSSQLQAPVLPLYCPAFGGGG